LTDDFLLKLNYKYRNILLPNFIEKCFGVSKEFKRDPEKRSFDAFLLRYKDFNAKGQIGFDTEDKTHRVLLSDRFIIMRPL